MKKLREQAFSHINAQLIESDQKHAKGPELPNPRFIFHNKIPKSGKPRVLFWQGWKMMVSDFNETCRIG